MTQPQQTLQQIEKSVLAYCGQAGLFAAAPSPCPVVVALSGGADSMALLRILLALAGSLHITVSACHVNHGLRGAAADADEAFVRAQCAALGVPLVVCSAVADGRPIPPAAGEDWARRLRYAYLEAQAARQQALVATAHTQNDQAETLLFRLARGTGAHGAAGIPPRRGRYVRPLLCLSRRQTEAYCAAAGQPYVTDETNLSLAYARNRLRSQALPALQSANAAAVRNLSAFCEKMAEVDAYFAAQAATLLAAAAQQAGGTAAAGPWALAPLRAAHPLVRRAALYQLVAPVRDAQQKYVRLLEQAVLAGGGVQLRPGVRFLAQGGVLCRCPPPPAPAGQAAPQFAPFGRPMQPGQRRQYDFGGGFRVQIALLDGQEKEKTQSVHKKDLKNVADYAKIALTSVLRTRMPGDTYRPAGRGVGKSLKKYQNEQGTPQAQRRQAPLLADGSRVLWLWGSGFADGLAPEASTQTVLCITECAAGEDVNT